MTDPRPRHDSRDWFGEHPARGGWRAMRRRTSLSDAVSPDATTPDGPSSAGRRPFSWQHDRSLWILDWEPDGWVLAELRFDRATCRYAEARRATYRWAREAAGCLLGHALAAGAVEAVALAARLETWLLAGPDRRA